MPMLPHACRDPENHHLSLRMHFRVDARQAVVRIESALGTLTSESHVTHVTFAAEMPAEIYVYSVTDTGADRDRLGGNS